MTEYPCEMVQDLLPLYHDNVCSSVTAQAVEEHLRDCEACQEAYHAITDADSLEPEQASGEDVHQARALKKVRGRFRRRALALCLAVLLLVTGAFTALLVWMNTATVVLPEDMVVRNKCGFSNGPNETRYCFNFEYDPKYKKYITQGNVVTVGGDAVVDGETERVLVFSRRVTVWESAWYDLTGGDGQPEEGRWDKEDIPVEWSSWKKTYDGVPPKGLNRKQGYIFTKAYFAPDCQSLEKFLELTPRERGKFLKQETVFIRGYHPYAE